MNTAPDLASEYSLWLLPQIEDENWLTTWMAKLASQFGCPSFLPHVTIQGDCRQGLADISVLAEKLARKIPRQSWTIRGVAYTPHYFRSLYLDFAPSVCFGRLQAAAVASNGNTAGLSPFPHLSLAYGGNLTDMQKNTIGLELERRFPAPMLALDRIAVVLSSKETAIANWRVCSVFHLAG